MRRSGKKEVPKINIMSLSMEAVQKDCREWARKIADNYSPDLIIFIAKSGYLFAEPLADHFKCEIKTAAYSVIDYSRNRISVDFFRYENVVILTAASRKSKEYDGFIAAYEKWLKHGV